MIWKVDRINKWLIFIISKVMIITNDHRGTNASLLFSFLNSGSETWPSKTWGSQMQNSLKRINDHHLGNTSAHGHFVLFVCSQAPEKIIRLHLTRYHPTWWLIFMTVWCPSNSCFLLFFDNVHLKWAYWNRNGQRD